MPKIQCNAIRARQFHAMPPMLNITDHKNTQSEPNTTPQFPIPYKPTECLPATIINPSFFMTFLLLAFLLARLDVLDERLLVDHTPVMPI